MWRNIKKNRFIVIKGLETLILGAYLIYVANFFDVDQPFGSIVHHFQDPWLGMLLIVVGSISTFAGILNLRRYNVIKWCLTSMVFVWALYLFVFIAQDVNEPGPISLNTIFVFFVLIQLFLDQAWGGEANG